MTFNDFYFKQYNIISLISNYQYYPEKNILKEEDFSAAGRISKTEILYGNFENIDANILIARETKDINYIINYNRFKINSYEVQNKKIPYSSFGYDYLKSGINFLIANDYMINLDFNYKYRHNGLHINTNYNNQIKRNIFFSPQLEYFFSEKSYLKFNFLYSDMNLEYESIKKGLGNRYSFFQSKIIYKRIWSSINYLHFEFFNILDSLRISDIPDTINNHYAYFNVTDKFAYSNKLIINLNLKFNINKKYRPMIYPGLNLFYIFKNFNIQIGYKHKYDYQFYYNYINKNNYYRFSSKNIPYPYLNHKIYSKIFINLFKYMSYSFNCSYNHTDNFPEIKEDNENLYILRPRDDINYIQIEQEVLFDIGKYFNILLNYKAIPFTWVPIREPDKISNLSRNTVFLDLGLNYALIKSGLTLKYYDMEYFIDNKNNISIIGSNIFMDIYTKLYFTETFGLMFRVKNLTGKKIVLTPNYPEIENIFNLGIIAEF